MLVLMPVGQTISWGSTPTVRSITCWSYDNNRSFVVKLCSLKFVRFQSIFWFLKYITYGQHNEHFPPWTLTNVICNFSDFIHTSRPLNDSVFGSLSRLSVPSSNFLLNHTHVMWCCVRTRVGWTKIEFCLLS